MTTNRMFTERYFEWLVGCIAVPVEPATYSGLLERLHEREFTWFVPNDDNRIADAMDLRHELWGEGHTIPQRQATVLEVIVALSRRLAFQNGGSPEKWAWQLIKNLKLHRMTDPVGASRRRQIDDILEALIWRTYEQNGLGGFFPLKHPDQDQTKVEIWYQMSAYLAERS
jgi:hypothetical protein